MTRFLRTILCCFIIAILNGCSDNATDPFDAVKFNAFDQGLNKRVEAYQQANFPNLANEKQGEARMYIDCSSGIYEAYKNNKNAELIKSLYNSLSGDIDVFKLDNDSIAPLENANSDLIGRLVINPLSYKGKYAPIKNAVEQITGLNNDAILVTDFEEYYPPNSGRKEIIDVACFKEAFTKWLSKGNSIKFFISDYIENGINKHLYFTVFSCGAPNNNSILSKINGQLNSLNIYNLTTAPYTLTNLYVAEKTGGCFYDNTGKDEKTKNVLDFKRETYINGLQENNRFEFYEFGIDWKTIDELRNEYQKQNEFKDFFRKLYVDLSNEDDYLINDLDVRVYDVTDDFVHFAKCNEVLNHKPKIIKGSNGEDKIDDKNSDDIALSCYEQNGQVKKDWIYNNDNGKTVPEIKEVFTLNKELFNNTKKTDKSKIEIGTAFHPNFNLKNIPNPSGLIRVDIVIVKAEPNLTNSKLNLFKWSSTTENSKENQALYESIRNTLGSEKVKPDNKVIYSYYIKAL